jgi:hypothetical protein
MASMFYDVSDPRRRALHRNYIRQCLDNFADCSNVVQMTSAEYSGPLEFTQFWLDTIIEWQRENSRDALIALSAPKDVQDGILADSIRGPHVDIIDIRYWAYTEDGSLYAPAGGKNLAPRQHLRQSRQKLGGAASIVKAVREYRTRYPNKAVTYYADMHCPSRRDGWAVLIGGGSLPNLQLPARLSAVIPSLRPADGILPGDEAWCLSDDGRNYLIYSELAGENIAINLPAGSARYRIHWINAETGELESGDEFAAGQPLSLKSKAVWLERASDD